MSQNQLVNAQSPEDDPIFNEHVAAKKLGLSVCTLRNWRFLRKGPSYLKVSRSVKYRNSDIENYKAKCLVKME